MTFILTEAHEIFKLYKKKILLLFAGFSIVVSSIWPYLLQVRKKKRGLKK